MIERGSHYWQIFAKCLQRLGIDTGFNRRQENFLRFHDLPGNHHFLRIKQVNGDSDGFTQMTANVLDHLAGQRIAFICGFADRFYRAVIEGDFALITLLQQMTNAMFNGGVGGDGFQTAEVAAVAALAQRVDLDMALQPAPSSPPEYAAYSE